QDEQLKLTQDEKELLKQKFQEEIMEYKEQIKQHSRTIVELEDRLLEAKQEQKTLEEENVTLLAKIEGSMHRLSKKSLLDLAVVFLVTFRELAAAQKAILSQEAVIAGLTKELAETKAQMSDMKGELSEKQKVELERNLSRVKSQESELSVLRGKLYEMSTLVDKKNKELKAVAEELRYKLLKPESAEGCLKRSSKRDPASNTSAGQHRGTRTNLTFQELALDLAELGAKCRGLRHEETIRRQKEGLAELRERIRLLEKAQAAALASRELEPLVLLKRDLPEKAAQRAGPVREHLLWPLPPGSCSRVREQAWVLLLVYLDLIRALGALMNMKELAGMQSVRHLPQEEREKVGLQRRKDLELLYERVSKLKSRLERKEEMLKDHESSAEQLRLNRVSLHTCREEVARLEDEVHREAEENALLKEALERTREQLNREKRLNRAVKLRQV
ncbi:FHAD1 protein, partial [Eudromia elegans]|nr:FHAD1 protein [Eudromia elegans]